MNGLLPDRLKAAWAEVEAGRSTAAEYEERKAQWLAEYRERWGAALLLEGRPDLKTSLLSEIAEHLPHHDPDAVERRCRDAVAALATEWSEQVAAPDRMSVERYYDQSET